MTQLTMLLPTIPVKEYAGQFRGVRDDEKQELSEVLAASFPGDTWDPARVARELTDARDVLDVLVAEADERLIATASGRQDIARFPGIGYIHWVAVAPTARGRGLGLDAVEAVLFALHERGFTQAVLETDDDRLPAIAAYLRLGFIPMYRHVDDPARWSDVMRALAQRRAGGAA